MNILDFPVRLATNIMQVVVSHKKTAITAVVGLVLKSQREAMNVMQESLIRVANALKDHISLGIEGGGLGILGKKGIQFGKFFEGRFQCAPSFTSYRLEVDLSKTEPNITDLYDRVNALYNNATSYGLDLLSSFDFYATSEGIDNDGDTVKGIFLICRSSFSHLFSP